MSHVLFVLAVAAASMSSGQYLSQPCDGQLVTTNQGDICGVELSSSLGGPGDPEFSYVAYQGIPYAQPPVGKLRFKNPVAGLPWEGVRDGNWSVPVCPQARNSDVYGEEDCLYLSVYTPKFSDAPLKDVPVMVYIHGGGFLKGGISEVDPQFFMAKDVIVVTLQYRLGYLGLLSTEDDAAPGNLVLKDQALALQWVHDNIAAFGGDKEKVTLFGFSAGSISSHTQMLNPQTKGLFSRVILLSGTVIEKLHLQEIGHHREVTGLLAKHFGCVDQDPGVSYDSQQVVACLQNLTPKDLVFAISLFAEWNGLPERFGFRVDDSVLLDHPVKLFKDGQYHMVDLMAGATSHEGAGGARGRLSQPELLDAVATNFSSIGHYSMEMLPDENHVAKEIYEYYLGGVRRYTEDDAEALAQMIGDNNINYPTDISVQLHARDTLYGRNIFKYEFQHRGQFYYKHKSAPQIGPEWVDHGEGPHYLFKLPEYKFKPLASPEDIRMRNIMLDLWTNFAKYGNPTPDRSLGFTWQPVSLESQPHLALKLQSHMESDKRCQVRSFFQTLDLPINRILFPGQVAAGKKWRPWRIQDTQNQCGA